MDESCHGPHEDTFTLLPASSAALPPGAPLGRCRELWLATPRQARAPAEGSMMRALAQGLGAFHDCIQRAATAVSACSQAVPVSEVITVPSLQWAEWTSSSKRAGQAAAAASGCTPSQTGRHGGLCWGRGCTGPSWSGFRAPSAGTSTGGRVALKPSPEASTDLP